MADGREFFVCQCFFTHNIFLKNYEAHVVFESEEQFQNEYHRALYNRGCKTEEKWKEVLKEVKDEVERRRKLGRDSQSRKNLIATKYKPLHPHVYTLKESFLADSFLSLVQYAKENRQATAAGLLSMVKQCDAKNVYAFQVFTLEFCQEFIEEINNFENTNLPKGRPNTMNNYGMMSRASPQTKDIRRGENGSSVGDLTLSENQEGRIRRIRRGENGSSVGDLTLSENQILLSELGFDEELFSPLRTNYLLPITRLLYPDCGGDSLDSHKAFTVHYKIGEDLDLSYHYDNAEVTLNVSLGKEFSGGELFFGDMRQVPIRETECTQFEHKLSYGLLHRGQHMHGALPIQSGERINLIIWMRSSTVRNKLCPMCNREPGLVPSVGTGDGFTLNSVPVCAAL